MGGDFLANWATISFSRRILLHGVGILVGSVNNGFVFAINEYQNYMNSEVK
jgi:hypothetical protein